MYTTTCDKNSRWFFTDCFWIIFIYLSSLGAPAPMTWTQTGQQLGIVLLCRWVVIGAICSWLYRAHQAPNGPIGDLRMPTHQADSHRGSTAGKGIHDIAWNMVKPWSIFWNILTKDTPYLAHMGEIWGVPCESRSEECSTYVNAVLCTIWYNILNCLMKSLHNANMWPDNANILKCHLTMLIRMNTHAGWIIKVTLC